MNLYRASVTAAISMVGALGVATIAFGFPSVEGTARRTSLPNPPIVQTTEDISLTKVQSFDAMTSGKPLDIVSITGDDFGVRGWQQPKPIHVKAGYIAVAMIGSKCSAAVQHGVESTYLVSIVTDHVFSYIYKANENDARSFFILHYGHDCS